MSKKEAWNHRAALPLSSALLALCSGLPACSPYPDDGEFFAAIVYSANFMDGTKALSETAAVGRGKLLDPERGIGPYTLVRTTGDSSVKAGTGTPPAKASSPLWTDGKRDPLSVESVQRVFVFDKPTSCLAPDGTPPFNERLDPIHLDRQYPIFEDIPEHLDMWKGKPGRTGAYSAIVQVIRLSMPGDFPCQSVKRFDTVMGRMEKDLKPAITGTREFRLLQIIDPGLTTQPRPYQRGWYNQLLVPYIDMGPVPLSQDGKRFLTMPVYTVRRDQALFSVVPGRADEPPVQGAPAYSPICEDYSLALGASDPDPLPDASDPAYQAAKSDGTLSTCIVCSTTNSQGGYACPFAESGAK